MLNKVISSVVLLSSLAFLIIANFNPNNFLFLFASANPVVEVLRVTLALSMVAVSFRNLLSQKFLRSALQYLGLGLMLFGLVALFETSISSAVYGYLKFLDFMVLMQAGVVYASSALATPTVQTASPKRQLASAKRAKAAPALKQRTA